MSTEAPKAAPLAFGSDPVSPWGRHRDANAPSSSSAVVRTEEFRTQLLIALGEVSGALRAVLLAPPLLRSDAQVSVMLNAAHRAVMGIAEAVLNDWPMEEVRRG